MSTVDYLQGYRAGEFTALLRSAPQVVNSAKQSALEIYGAARHVDLSAEETLLMVAMATEMETAAANLRKAAGGFKPALRLVAAE